MHLGDSKYMHELVDHILNSKKSNGSAPKTSKGAKAILHTVLSSYLVQRFSDIKVIKHHRHKRDLKAAANAKK